MYKINRVVSVITMIFMGNMMFISLVAETHLRLLQFFSVAIAFFAALTSFGCEWRRKYIKRSIACYFLSIVFSFIDYLILGTPSDAISTVILLTIPLILNVLILSGKFNLYKANAPIRKKAKRMNKANYCMTKNKYKYKKKNGGNSIPEILMKRDGITLKEANKRIRQCQRDLDAAMDEGADLELEDIVEEELGIDGSYVDELI